jgi:hypothetical protein
MRDLGLSYNQSHHDQTIASFSTPAFEAHLSRTKAAGMKLTSAGVYWEAKRQGETSWAPSPTGIPSNTFASSKACFWDTSGPPSMG